MLLYYQITIYCYYIKTHAQKNGISSITVSNLYSWFTSWGYSPSISAAGTNNVLTFTKLIAVLILPYC